MAGSTFTPGQEALRSYMMHGGGNKDLFVAFMKAVMNKDLALKVTPATAAPAPTAAAWTQEVVVTLETADGEIIPYSGPVVLAIADTSVAGTATIDPAAGSHYMTDGVLEVVISGDAAAWLAGETVTLTVSINDEDPGGGTTDKNILGVAVADKTCVITFTA